MFLTEREVADRLRYSLSKVRRLRLSGKLAYLPGRPPLVEEDLEAYIAIAKCKATPPPPPTPEDVKANGIAEARQRARMAWLKMQMRRMRKPDGERAKTAAPPRRLKWH